MPEPALVPGAAGWKSAHSADAAASAVLVDAETFGAGVDVIDAALRTRPYGGGRYEIAREALEDAVGVLGCPRLEGPRVHT